MAYIGDAGEDITCSHGFSLRPMQIADVETGFRRRVERGTVGFVVSRSGLSKKGVVVINAPGIIDSGYTGEIRVLLINLGDSVVEFSQNDRIAQFVVCPVVEPATSSDRVRGENGFGSSGV